MDWMYLIECVADDLRKLADENFLSTTPYPDQFRGMAQDLEDALEEARN